MSFDTLGPGGLEYYPCRYPGSKLLYRGPRRDLKEPYIAFVGGTHTYGKFVEHPFPDLVEDSLDLTCANLGCMNAGVDLFLNDAFLQDAVKDAILTVVQVSSPRNMSNRYYSVHPRRNDRFVKPSALLQTIYRDVDFSEFNFTKHLMKRLHEISSVRFQAVIEELQTAWLARMQLLLTEIPGKTVLLWVSDHAPENGQDEFGYDPWFVSSDLLDHVRPYATEYVEVVISAEARAVGTQGMIFSELEAPAANHLLGPLAHREAADQLVPVINGLLP